MRIHDELTRWNAALVSGKILHILLYGKIVHAKFYGGFSAYRQSQVVQRREGLWFHYS